MLIFICTYAWVRRPQIRSSLPLLPPANSAVFGTRSLCGALPLSFDLLLYEGHCSFQLLLWENVFLIQLLFWENLPNLSTGNFLQDCVDFHYNVMVLSLRKTRNTEKTWHGRKNTGNWVLALLIAVWIHWFWGLVSLFEKSGALIISVEVDLVRT